MALLDVAVGRPCAAPVAPDRGDARNDLAGRRRRRLLGGERLRPARCTMAGPAPVNSVVHERVAAEDRGRGDATASPSTTRSMLFVSTVRSSLTDRRASDVAALVGLAEQDEVGRVAALDRRRRSRRPRPAPGRCPPRSPVAYTLAAPYSPRAAAIADGVARRVDDGSTVAAPRPRALVSNSSVSVMGSPAAMPRRRPTPVQSHGSPACSSDDFQLLEERDDLGEALAVVLDDLAGLRALGRLDVRRSFGRRRPSPTDGRRARGRRPSPGRPASTSPP